jgi:hypothetical protein
MSEAPKLLYASPIEKYLDQIGHWLVVTTAQMGRGESKPEPPWKQFEDTIIRIQPLRNGSPTI